MPLRRLHFASLLVCLTALHHIADHSKTIEDLDVGWCQQLTIDGVMKVVKSCIKSLKYFGLMRCDKVLSDRKIPF